MIEHLSEEASNVGATRESEEVNVIAILIVTHQESVACHNMFIECGANGRIFGFVVP